MNKVGLLLIGFFLMSVELLAQTTGDFRTRDHGGTAGNWNQSDTWEEFTGSGWVNTTNTPTNANGVITISHPVFATANVSIDQTTVTSTGSITINSGITLSLSNGIGTDLVVNNGGTIYNNGSLILSTFGGSQTTVINGTFNNSGSISGAGSNRLDFGSTATYNHLLNGGAVPSATWASDSDCIILGSESLGPTGLNQTFGNFTWNTPSLSSGSGESNMNLSDLSEFNGDFVIESTGSDVLILSDLTSEINCNSNFIVTGNSAIAITNSGNVTLIVDGDFTYSSSNNSYFSVEGSANIQLAGDFNYSNGSLSVLQSSGSGLLTFNGIAPQNFSNTSGVNFTGANNPNITVATGASLSLLGSDISCNNLQTNAGSTLTSLSSNLYINGVFTNNGTFNHNNGVINFNGTNSLAGDVNPTFNDIEINGTFTAPETLSLLHDFTNNGSFVHNGGTVEFNGTTTQTIAGSTAIDFNNIIINNTAGSPAVTLNGTANLYGILTISNSGTIFDADGAGSRVFTVVSGASSDGNIASIPAGSSISGNVTVQRFIHGEGRIWRYLSSSVENATVASWQDDFTIIGPYNGWPNNVSMYEYDESLGGTIDDRWSPYPQSSNTEPLTPGKGYTAFMNNGNAIIADVRGPINQGDVDISGSISYSGPTVDDGWNLVGNPYPSVLDWEAVHADATNVEATYAVRNNGDGGGSVAYYTVGGASLNGGDRYIAMGQAFWVRTTGSSSLVFSESHKSINSATFLRQGRSEALIISLNRDSQKDETALFISPEASDEYDTGFDFYKLNNEKFDLSTLTSDNISVAINHVGEVTCSKSVYLNVKDVKNGIYTLNFEGIENFDAYSITLIDHFASTHFDLSVTAELEFGVDLTDEGSFGSQRFEIRFDKKLDTALEVAVSDGCNSLSGSLVISDSKEGIFYELLDLEGNVIAEIGGSNSDISLTVPQEQSGKELILHAGFEGCEKKIRIDTFLVQHTVIEPAITIENGFTLLSNYEFGNQWYLENEIIEGATFSEYEAGTPGVYSLEVTQNGCSARISRELLITGMESNLQPSIHVYPVPVKNMLNIQLDGNSEINLFNSEMTIHSLEGKLIGTLSPNIIDYKRAVIDFSTAKNGFYILVIRTGEQVFYTKVIKE